MAKWEKGGNPILILKYISGPILNFGLHYKKKIPN